MGASNSLYPHSKQQDMELIRREEWNFELGQVSDVNPTNVPNKAVYDLDNMRGTSNGLRGRHGTSLVADVTLPTVESGLALTRVGDQITASTAIFAENRIDYKIGTDDGRAFFIQDVSVDFKTATVIGKDVTGSETLTDATVRGQINAQFFDFVTGFRYYLIGSELFYRNGFGPFSDTYFVHSALKPFASFSVFYKIGKYVCISNQHGIYVLNDPVDGLYAWKANDSLPQYKIDRSVAATSKYVDPSAYNVAYTYTRMKGDYLDNRLNIGSFLECETPPYNVPYRDVDDLQAVPPYYPDGKSSDITTVLFEEPIGKTIGVPLYIDLSSYLKVPKWKALYETEANPFLQITFNGASYQVFFSFSGANTMEDVSLSLQDGFNSTVSKNIRVTRYLISPTDDLTFLVYSQDNDDSIAFTSPGNGADTFDLLYSPPLSSPVLGQTTQRKYLGKLIQYFRYPEDRSDITHYSLYRSQDIYPHLQDPKDLTDPRILNQPGVLGWVDDIPVCKIIKIDSIVFDSDEYIATITDPRFNEHDVGCTIWHDVVGATPAGNFTLKKKLSESGTYEVIGEVITGTDVYCWIGTDDVDNYVEFTKTDGVVRIDVGTYAMSISDIGKIIFWQDGTYDIIKDFGTDGTGDYFETVDSGSHISSPCLMNPTYREYNDSTTQNELTGYTTAYPLNTRFFDQMPNTNIAAYYNGLLLSAKFGETLLSFSDCLELHKLGYKNATKQINDVLERSITSITVVNGYFTICTEDTHIINPAQLVTGGNTSLGEAFTILPDPILIAKGVGTTHQSKWGEGLPNGKVVITNEPAVRIFNGTGYGENLAEGKIQRSELQRLDSLVLVGVDKHSGLYMWGKRS